MLHSRNWLPWGIVLLAFGAVVLALVGKGIPDRSQLTEVVGQLKSIDKTTSKGGGLSAVRFSLTTDPRHFHYLSKAGNIDKVFSALQQAGQAKVSLLTDFADPHTAPFEDIAYYMAYEISVGSNPIANHTEVAKSLGTDHVVGKFLGYGTAGTGFALMLLHLLKRRRHA